MAPKTLCWLYPLRYWNRWTKGKPVGSNSGTLWAISAAQKPIAPALSLTQTQHAPSLHPAAAMCSPRTEDDGLCPAGAGGQAPSWDRLNKALVLFRLVLSCVLELWSPLLIPTQTWEWKKMTRHRTIFCTSRKDVGIMLCSSSSEKAARRERIETV